MNSIGGHAGFENTRITGWAFSQLRSSSVSEERNAVAMVDVESIEAGAVALLGACFAVTGDGAEGACVEPVAFKHIRQMPTMTKRTSARHTGSALVRAEKSPELRGTFMNLRSYAIQVLEDFSEWWVDGRGQVSRSLK